MIVLLLHTVQAAVRQDDMQNEADDQVSFSILINNDQKGDTDTEEKDTYIPRFIQAIPNEVTASTSKLVSEIEIHGLTPKTIGAKTKRRARDRPYEAPQEDYGHTIYELKFKDINKMYQQYPVFWKRFEEAWESEIMTDSGKVVRTFRDDLAKARKKWYQDKQNRNGGKQPNRYASRYNVPLNKPWGYSVMIIIFLSCSFTCFMSILYLYYTYTDW